MRLLSVWLSQPAEAWSHHRTSGFLRLLCSTVDSEARHKPLFQAPGWPLWSQSQGPKPIRSDSSTKPASLNPSSRPPCLDRSTRASPRNQNPDQPTCWPRHQAYLPKVSSSHVHQQDLWGADWWQGLPNEARLRRLEEVPTPSNMQTPTEEHKDPDIKETAIPLKETGKTPVTDRKKGTPTNCLQNLGGLLFLDWRLRNGKSGLTSSSCVVSQL